MRDYNRLKQSKYILPRNLYLRTIWTIRDYNRLREEADDMLEESPEPADGQPRGTAIGDPVMSTAMKREKNMGVIMAIDKAKGIIPDEYQKGIWRNILYGEPMPRDADRTTYGRWKSRFVYEVARNLFLV